MPFHEIKLNDGRKIPQIGFGTWKIPQEVTAAQVNQAVEVGFDHIDTAQGGSRVSILPPSSLSRLAPSTDP
jgi:predicted aldo/keto reductase-like oxidoreductase